MRKAAILIAILVLGTAAVGSQELPEKKFYLKIQFNNNSTAEVLNSSITESGKTSSFYSLTENYTLEITDKENNTLFEGEIPITFDAIIRGQGIQERKKIVKPLWTPYRPDAYYLKIKKDGELIKNEPLARKICEENSECTEFCSGKEVSLSCTCGDGICQEGLNERQFCSQDCESPGQNEESPGNTSTPNGEEIVNESYGIYILVGIAVLAILILLFMASGKVKIEG